VMSINKASWHSTEIADKTLFPVEMNECLEVTKVCGMSERIFRNVFVDLEPWVSWDVAGLMEFVSMLVMILLTSDKSLSLPFVFRL
jgi:hypothetical protein